MSGQVIPFPGFGELKRGGLYRITRRDDEELDRQMSRIADLLVELESLSHTARNIPAPTLKKAQATMDRARQLMSSVADEVNEPQPEIDSEMLERMYRSANPDKLKPTS